MNLTTVTIENKNGMLLVSSRNIAKELGKKHKHVIEKIKEISRDFDPSWIMESEYKNSMNRTKKNFY